MKKLLLFVFAALAFTACTQDVVVKTSPAPVPDNIPETLIVDFEESTRIQLQNGKTVWTSGDQVSVFYLSNANQKWQYNGETGSRIAELSRVDTGSATQELSEIIVIYPYNENYYINSTSCNVHAMLPSIQTYLTNSYGLDGNIMVSSEKFNKFSLKNICGWVKLQITGNGEQIKSIKLRGNNEEQVAGLIYIDTSDASCMLAQENESVTDGGVENTTNGIGGNLVFDDTIITEITLNCLNKAIGVELEETATSFYIALPPQSFDNGITIEITDTHGYTMTKSTDKAITIERNKIQPMKTFEFNYENCISNNEIRYTATEKLQLTQYNWYNDPVIWDSEILSHNFNEETGQGVIVFKDEITTIHKWAFWDQYALTSITIPNSVKEIEEVAFNCENITRFYGNHTSEDGSYVSANNHFIAFAPKHHSTTCIIPDNITTIDRAAFWKCDNLQTILIPDSVTTIGADAFTYCDNLQQITIPENVTSIGWGAFYSCYSLEKVYCKAVIPPSIVTEYSSWYAFSGNAHNRKIYVPLESVEAYKTANGWRNYANDIVGYDFSQDISNNNSCTINGYHASFTMYDSGSLYSLAKKALDNIDTDEEWGEEIWSDITSITINGVMDARDFSTLKWNFRNLETLDISNVNVTDYNGDKGTVEGYSYYYYEDTIPLGAFFYWMSNELRTFPQELCDEGMASLVSIKLPDGIKTIQRNAFARAYNLIDINIPDSVETIGWVSFSICTSLEHITIPEYVLEIEDWAFKGCSSLNSVYCKALYPPICGSRVFDDNASNRKIYVPNGSVELYKNADGWKDYADDIVAFSSDIIQSKLSIKTIVIDSTQQPIYAGGYIDGYNNVDILKKGVIVSKSTKLLDINENTCYEISPISDLYTGHKYVDGIVEDSSTNRNFKAPQDLSVYDCSNINKEQFITPLICLEGTTKYYIRAYVITEDNDYIYGDIIEIDTMPYERCCDGMAYANVLYWDDYTLFDLVTDEIININNGFYYSTNEMPTVVEFQKGYSYNTCYKFATEWNYKLWYYHNINHCDMDKVVDIPIMSVTGDVLSIIKSQNDINKDITIVYQINGDGSTPENFDNTYTEPINVTSGDIVYCYAISNDGYISYTNVYVVQ